MKIELKLKRTGGSEIDMGDGTAYHFKPEDGRHESPHVAEVGDSGHVKRLLSIEGYDIFDPEAPGAEPLPPLGDYEGEPTAPEIDAPAEGADIPLEHMTETGLRAVYELELGKKPHHRAGMEKLIQDIKAHRAEQE